MDFLDNVFYSARDYTLDFGKTTYPIKPVSFDIGEGDRVIVHWESKSLGKTSFIEGLVGLHRNFTGDIFINNKKIFSLNREQKHSFRSSSSIIFQKPALISNLTVRENIALPLKYHSNFDDNITLSNDDIYDMTSDTIEQFGLKGHENKLPESLTLDQSKTVSFARTLIREPKLLFLDNPTSGLSGDGFKIFFEIALEKIINNKSMVVVALTHHPKIIEKLSPNREITVVDL